MTVIAPQARASVAPVMLAAYVVLAAALTIGPTPTDAIEAGLQRLLVSADDARILHLTGVFEKLFNVAGTMPLGLLLPVVFRRVSPYAAVAITAGISTGVEVLQSFIGRSPQLDDIGLNTLGALLGSLVLIAWRQRDR
jgi:VanZ family protein